MPASTNTPVPLDVEKIYLAYNMAISPSVAGLKHDFNYRGKKVTIQLPQKPKVREWSGENLPITCSKWRVSAGRKRPVSYEIHEITVRLETGVARKLPRTASSTFKTSDFSNAQLERLFKFISRTEPELNEAYYYWVDVLRWATSKPTLLQRSHVAQESSHGTSLLETGTQRRLGIGTNFLTVKGGTNIDKRAWSKAEQLLKSETVVPVWQLIYSEAFQRQSLSDSRGLVVGLTTALETAVHEMTRTLLKESASEKYAALTGNISTKVLLQQWKKIGFSSSLWNHVMESHRSQLLELIDVRNQVVHRGREPNLTKQKLSDLGSSVASFLAATERALKYYS